MDYKIPDNSPSTGAFDAFHALTAVKQVPDSTTAHYRQDSAAKQHGGKGRGYRSIQISACSIQPRSFPTAPWTLPGKINPSGLSRHCARQTNKNEEN